MSVSGIGSTNWYRPEPDTTRVILRIDKSQIVSKIIQLFPDGCLFPLSAKTAQSLLHNEQSGLNTGLYSPEENIPLDILNVICLKSAHRIPLLTVHWSHLLIRYVMFPFLNKKLVENIVQFNLNRA